MPELPEVESIRLGLEKVLKNKKILKVQILNPKLVASKSPKRKADKKKTEEFIKNIQNKKIISLKRRAKNLILELNNSKNEAGIILVHLKMTGQLVFVSSKNQKILGGHPILESYSQDLPNKHTQIIFNLENGNLFYNDVRKFGYMLYYKNLAEIIQNKHFEKLGLEPFEKKFTEKYWREKILTKNKNLKQVLLEQTIVVGCGNIYTDEICFAAKVLPQRICKTLNDREIQALFKNIKIIFQKAIQVGGSSVVNHRLVDGSQGNYARQHKVYGQAGQKCHTKNCLNILEKITISGRTTVFCTNCQK